MAQQRRLSQGVIRPRERRNPAAPTRRGAVRADHAALLIAPGDLSMPSLEGCPVVLSGRGDAVLAIQYCEAFIKAGVFDISLWRGNPRRFLAEGMAGFVKRNYAPVSEDIFDLGCYLTTSDPTDTYNQGPVSREQFHVHFEWGSIAEVCFQPLYDGSSDACAFIWRFIRAFSRWWPIFSFEEVGMALDRRNESLEMDRHDEIAAAKEENRAANFDGIEELKPEFPELLRPPRSLRIAGKGRAVELLAKLEKESRRGKLRPIWREEDEQWMDLDSPFPVLFAHMYPGDQLTGWLDEEGEYAMQVDHWPPYYDRIECPEPKTIRQVFGRLAIALRVLSATSDLVSFINDVGEGKKTKRRAGKR